MSNKSGKGKRKVIDITEDHIDIVEDVFDTTEDASDITSSDAPIPSVILTKAFLVGQCRGFHFFPIFAEAAPNINGTLPKMDDSRDGLRFVKRDGEEHLEFIPFTGLCCLGAVTEIKKYLYDLEVDWLPGRGVGERGLTRDRDRGGRVEAAFDRFLVARGIRPNLRQYYRLCRP